MPACERCKQLERILAQERKEAARVKLLAKHTAERAKERKKLLDQTVKGQMAADKAARRAISAVLQALQCGPCKEYVQAHYTRLRDIGVAALDTYEAPPIPARIASEHAMPRHGKQSS